MYLVCDGGALIVRRCLREEGSMWLYSLRRLPAKDHSK